MAGKPDTSFWAPGALRGLVDMGASAAKGAVAGTVGLPGDIEALIRMLSGTTKGQHMLTTEDVHRLLPETGAKGYKGYESVGEVLGIPGVGSAAMKAAAPLAKQLREVSKIEKAVPEARRGFLKTAGQTGAVAAGASLGLGGTEALVKALRGEGKVVAKLTGREARIAAAKRLRDLSDEDMDWLMENDPGHRLFDEVVEIDPKKGRTFDDLRASVSSKVDDFRDYENDMIESLDGRYKKYTDDEFLMTAKEHFPGKTDREVLEIYDRMLDMEPFAKGGKWGNKTLADIKTSSGKPVYGKTTEPTWMDYRGKPIHIDGDEWDYDQANEVMQMVIDGKINPRDFKAGTFHSFPWGDTDYFDARMPLYGHWEDLKGAKASEIGGAATAMFVPAMKLRGNQAMMDKAVDLAQTDKKKLWQELQVSQSPTRPKDDPNLPQFWEELNDENALFKSNLPTMSQPDKTEYIQNTFSPLQQEGARRRASSIVIPRPGTYSQEDFMLHPELFDKFPELKKSQVQVVNEPDLPWRGKFNSNSDQGVMLNLPRFFDSPNPGGGVMGTNLHELTHKLAKESDLPIGSSTSWFQAPPETWNRLEAYTQNPKFMEGLGPEGARHASNLLRYKNEPAFRAYHNSPGEKYARQAQERFMLDSAERQHFDPHGAGLSGIYDEPDSDFALQLLHTLKQGMPPEQVTDALRKWGRTR